MSAAAELAEPTAAAVPLTAEQRAVVEDRTGSLLVSAGAGSGKTGVIVERFVRAVVDDGVAVDRILAITFTDKAAGELRERLRRRFAELGEREAARATEGAFVSTIHGFCARLLRAQALRAGIDPHFTVLGEVESERLQQEAFADALDRVVAEGGDAVLEALVHYRVETVRALVRGAHGLLRVRGQERPRLPDVTPADVVAARARLDEARAALAAELGALDAEAAGVAGGLAALERCGEVLARLEPGEATAVAELEDTRLPGAQSKALSGPAADAFREALAGFARACLEHELLPTHRALADLVAAYDDRYRELRRARSALDFEDLELRTAAVLEQDDRMRDRYARRFDLIMVDEFQDTNPLQLRILERLSRENLLCVGDEFQSIYRFRHADVDLFRRRRDELEEEGRTRSLSLNFRSEPELLAAIDAACARPLEEGGLFGQAFPALRAGIESTAGPQPPVELLVTEICDNGGPSWKEVLPDADGPAWRLAEARVLACRLRDLREEGFAPGDMVVLLRAATDIGIYQRALEEQGLPTYVIGATGYWDAPEVADLLAYLGVVANPHDDPRLYDALASPLGGISSDGLALLSEAAQEHGVGPWRLLEEDSDGDWTTPIPPADRAGLAAFTQRLHGHRAAAARLALDSLVERALVDAGYDLHLLALPQAVRRMANVRKLMRLAREYEEANGRDLRGLLDLAAERATAGTWSFDEPPDREAEAPVESESLDAVRLMTIHRGKGLEFPVVCVADLGRRPRTESSYLALGDDGSLGLKIPSGAGNGPRAAYDWDRLAEAERPAELAEERRLYYVAMTRAQRKLILSGAIERKGWDEGRVREPLALLAGALLPELAERLTADAPEQELAAELGEWRARIRCRLATPANYAELVCQPPETPPAEAEPAAPPLPPPAAVPPPPAPVDHLSYSALEAYQRCGYRFYLEQVLGLPAVEEPAAGGGGLSAADRGTLTHLLLEGLDFADPRALPPAEVVGVAAGEGIVASPAEAEEIAGLVAGFAQAPLCGRLAGATDIGRERRFSFLLDVPGAGPGALVTGALDVAAREGERVLVVDYKTDRIEPGDQQAHTERVYRIQRLVYALAALRTGAPEVEVVHCFLADPAHPVEARFTAADAGALAAELGALAASISAQSFPVAAEPHRELCHGCPGRPAMCSWDEAMTGRDPA